MYRRTNLLNLKMKFFSFLFLLLVYGFSCPRHPNNVPVSEKIVTSDSLNPRLISQISQRRPGQFRVLDWLQGTWVSVADSSWKIKVTPNQWITIYENQVEEIADFYLADHCVEDIKGLEPKPNSSGEYIISYTKRDSLVFCYHLLDDESTMESFSYYYPSKTHTFERCEDFPME